MRRMAAGFFKVHCLAVMDEVQAKRESVVNTKHGKPVAKLVPADQNADDIYNFLAGKGTMIGDVVSPAISDEEWGDWRLQSLSQQPQRFSPHPHDGVEHKRALNRAGKGIRGRICAVCWAATSDRGSR